jgi:hypothetical protein
MNLTSIYININIYFLNRKSNKSRFIAKNIENSNYIFVNMRQIFFKYLWIDSQFIDIIIEFVKNKLIEWFDGLNVFQDFKQMDSTENLQLIVFNE